MWRQQNTCAWNERSFQAALLRQVWKLSLACRAMQSLQMTVFSKLGRQAGTLV
jgi:hypothetical protein